MRVSSPIVWSVMSILFRVTVTSTITLLLSLDPVFTPMYQEAISSQQYKQLPYFLHFTHSNLAFILGPGRNEEEVLGLGVKTYNCV